MSALACILRQLEIRRLGEIGMSPVDLDKLARQLTTAQIRQLAQIVESAPELARLKARREEILASIAHVEADIANITNAAPKPSTLSETAKQSRPRRVGRPSRDVGMDSPVSEAPASIQVPEASLKSDAPTDDSATTAQLPVRENGEMNTEAAAADDGAMTHAPAVDSTTPAQPSAPEGPGVTAKMETVADGPVAVAPCRPADDPATSEQPSVAEDAATI